MDIGSKIKTLRKESKLTQAELSLKANISRSYLADIERNRYNPSVDTLTSIAKALGLSLSELVNNKKSDNDRITRTTEYFIEWYLINLGYKILYDSEGNVILETPSDEYEISELDLKDLQNSVDSFVKFKLSEIMSKSRKIPKNLDIPVAAHNDFADDEEQQRLMREDIDEL